MPTADEVLASLNAAADAASDAYDAAVAANPDGNFKALHKAKMQAASIAAAAINKALDGNSEVVAAKRKLVAAIDDINSKLSTLKDIQQWLTLLNNLVSLATTVGKFFVA